ncbi:MAG: protein kinase [Acidobacteria bacterium]|nr:protein kinase [Acidobacteriota bacterium]
MALPPGSRFGPYELTALLGAGGMGEVYRARDTRLGRDVAVKVLPAGAQSAEARQRFAREARVVAALQHPNICGVYDVGDTPDGHGYLVMELLQGETLQQQIARASPPPPLDHVLDTAAALADALEAAHAAGVVHRDIKPANIVLTPRGPKILDFGIAKTPVDQSPDGATTKGAWRTETGITLGTLAYMSPEQLRGEPVDARSDLFSFGLVLYEMIARRPAFTGDTGVAVAAALLHRQPAPLRAARPDVPPALEAVVFKALEKDRALRYQHASELRSDLLRLERDLTAPSAEVSTSAGPTSRRWTTAVAAGIGLALALAAGFVYSRPSRAAALSDTDTIVLADFSNTTGDAVFDDTLRQGLSVQLQQSPFLSLVAEARIRRTLGQMGQPADARVTPQLAAEVCERVGATAVLDGSITSLGTQYVIGLRARTCATGDLLAEEQTQAARKEDVLDALSRVATAFRARVGESLATVTQYSVPLVEATTPSLEALKAYSAAQRINLSRGGFEAVPMYRRALELDPAFAVAHGGLGLAYSAMGESAASIFHTRRAFELRGRATDRERFYISVLYERQVTGNLERARQVFDAWLQVYPRDAVGHCLYGGFTTHGTGRLEQVIDESAKCLSLDPDIGYGYANTALASIFLDRPDQRATRWPVPTPASCRWRSTRCCGTGLRSCEGPRWHRTKRRRAPPETRRRSWRTCSRSCRRCTARSVARGPSRIGRRRSRSGTAVRRAPRPSR